MAEDPAPVPAPAPAATPAPVDNAAVLASLYQDYNPQGAMGGLFAPAYIRGLKSSEDAVSAWNAANHSVNRSVVDATAMPNLYTPPTPKTAADGVYGSGVPVNQSYGAAGGTVDPAALRAWAQGGSYDINARRAAIAARIAQNAALQAAQPAPAPADPTGGMKFIFD